MSRRWVLVAVGVAVVVVVSTVVVLVVARGSEDTDDLAARVVAIGAPDRLVVADLAEARSVLGLADDTDPTGLGLDDDDERRFRAVVVAFPHLVGAAAPEVAEAFDLGQVSAVAGNGARGAAGVTVMRTEQSLDDLAEALEPLGYERDGDLLVHPDPAEVVTSRYVYTAVGGADGLLVMSTDREDPAAVVQRALADPDDTDDDLLELAGELDGPVSALVRGTDCVTAYAIDDPLDGDADLVLVSSDPDAVQVEVGDDEPFRGVSAGGAEVSGDRVEVALETDLEQVIGGPVVYAVSGEVLPGQVFSCG